MRVDTRSTWVDDDPCTHGRCYSKKQVRDPKHSIHSSDRPRSQCFFGCGIGRYPDSPRLWGTAVVVDVGIGCCSNHFRSSRRYPLRTEVPPFLLLSQQFRSVIFPQEGSSHDPAVLPLVIDLCVGCSECFEQFSDMRICPLWGLSQLL